MNAPERELSKSIEIYQRNFAEAAKDGKSVFINKENVPLLAQTFTALLQSAQNLEDELFHFQNLMRDAEDRAIASGRLNAQDGETVQ